jgi:hypothetical protein
VTDADTRLPSQGENDALAGTSGTPSSSNKFVTDVDTRVPSQSENDALAGTSGTPSSSNKFVTDADTRVPSQGENDALAGTSGTPSSSNKYVTDVDPRLAVTGDSNKRMIEGLVPSRVGVAILEISAGVAFSDDATTVMQLLTAVNLDLTTVGANGRDQGVLSSSSWYYLYVIKNVTSGAVATLASLSATAPTLPSGYTKRRRIGVCRVTAASDILNAVVSGKGTSRAYYYVESFDTTLRILSAGTAIVWTDVSAGTLIPPTSRMGCFQCMGLIDQARFALVRPNGTSISGTARIHGSETAHTYLYTDATQVVEYMVSNAALEFYLSVMGFFEEL